MCRIETLQITVLTVHSIQTQFDDNFFAVRYVTLRFKQMSVVRPRPKKLKKLSTICRSKITKRNLDLKRSFSLTLNKEND